MTERTEIAKILITYLHIINTYKDFFEINTMKGESESVKKIE